MYVLFRLVDEVSNAFVMDGRVDGVHEIAFRAMAAECSSTPDDDGGVVADLYDEHGNLYDVAVMPRQMRVRAQRALEAWH